MTEKINELLRCVEEFEPRTAAEVEEFRIRMTGKKGELNALMEEFRTVAPELKREVGQQLNRLKTAATERIAACANAWPRSTTPMSCATGKPVTATN